MTSTISTGARSECPCYTDSALCRLALLGVIYLISSMIANQYKREGLRLWLYRCSWGKAPIPTWTHSDEDHKDELRTLREICLRPNLVARATSLPYYDRGPVRTQASGYSSCCRPSWLAQTSNCRRPWSTVAGSLTEKRPAQ